MKQVERTRKLIDQSRKGGKPTPWGWIVVIILVLIALAPMGRRDNPPISHQDSYRAATNDRSRPLDSDYTRAAERAGYRGSDAEKVGAAAESMCLNTGKC